MDAPPGAADGPADPDASFADDTDAAAAAAATNGEFQSPANAQSDDALLKGGAAANKRSTMTKSQSAIFEVVYNSNQYRRPPRAEVEKLARDSNVDFQKVYNWFSNRITRDKKKAQSPMLDASRYMSGTRASMPPGMTSLSISSSATDRVGSASAPVLPPCGATTDRKTLSQSLPSPVIHPMQTQRSTVSAPMPMSSKKMTPSPVVIGPPASYTSIPPEGNLPLPLTVSFTESRKRSKTTNQPNVKHPKIPLPSSHLANLSEVEDMFRLIPMGAPHRILLSTLSTLSTSLSRYRTLDTAMPQYFRLGYITWSSLPQVESQQLKQQLILAHSETSYRFRRLDVRLEATLRPPVPDEPGFFHNGTWTFLVECFTRYQTDFRVEPNSVKPDVSRILPVYRRVSNRPENSQLENVKSRLVFEIEKLLSVPGSLNLRSVWSKSSRRRSRELEGKNRYHTQADEAAAREESIVSHQVDFFICKVFCVCLSLVTSNIAAETLISRGLNDELQQIRFALDLCFEHPVISRRLHAGHTRLLMAGVVVLQAGLSMARPVHRPAIPVKSLLQQIKGQVSVGSVEPAKMYRLITQEVDNTPSVPVLVTPLLDHICRYASWQQPK